MDDGIESKTLVKLITGAYIGIAITSFILVIVIDKSKSAENAIHANNILVMGIISSILSIITPIAYVICCRKEDKQKEKEE